MKICHKTTENSTAKAVLEVSLTFRNISSALCFQTSTSHFHQNIQCVFKESVEKALFTVGSVLETQWLYSPSHHALVILHDCHFSKGRHFPSRLLIHIQSSFSSINDEWILRGNWEVYALHMWTDGSHQRIKLESGEIVKTENIMHKDLLQIFTRQSCIWHISIPECHRSLTSDASLNKLQ